MGTGKLTCPQLALANKIQMFSVFCLFVLNKHSLVCYQPWLFSRALKLLILVNSVHCSLWLYGWDNFQRSLLCCFHWLSSFCCDFWRLCHVAQNFILAVVFLQCWKYVTNYVLVSIASTEESAISLTVLVLKLAWPFFMALSKVSFPVFGGSLLE